MRSSRSVTAVALASALVLAACGGAGETPANNGGAKSGEPAPGVTDTEVVIGSHHPLTGPAAPGYSKISVGARAVYDYINDGGGVNGRKITYKVEDDGYNPTKTVEVVKKLVLEDKVFAIVGGLGTPTHSKVLDYLTTEGVPDVLVSSGALMWNAPEKHPNTFGYQLDYTREGKIQGKFIKEKLAGKKVGLLVQNDDIGTDTQKGLDQFIKDQIVERKTYDPANTDVTPQISALQAAGAEVVVCECIPAFTALTILTSLKIGYKPQLMVSSIGADPATLTGLVEQFAKQGGTQVSGGALLTGIMGTRYLPSVRGASDPWTEFFKGIHDKYIPQEPFTDTMVYGMVQAYTFSQALKAAGKDLTRQKLLDAMSSGELKGPGLTPFAYSKDDHAGYTGALVFQIAADGSVNTLEEAMTTDTESGEVKAVDDKRPTPQEVKLVG
ncbi:ABC transporter substrate-binding protein [Umezawaea endophytica]|uniref:ABC transporter substrate-binding protein n=1 Tax=Umezawaea endophytica TaxID=1654476 RepID=A0A9X3AJS8_9PSEU|nr:ABC transporter substrate-binding protein [Umezawaea endophytica]MCS7481950.1 ABC transporter substrate-binding protein [Umezawaea endophytica]